MTATPSCPLCGSASQKVIYLGLPMRLCEGDSCWCLFGVWSFVATWLPITSEDEYGDPAWAFYQYDGSYPLALAKWLIGR